MNFQAPGGGQRGQNVCENRSNNAFCIDLCWLGHKRPPGSMFGQFLDHCLDAFFGCLFHDLLVCFFNAVSYRLASLPPGRPASWPPGAQNGLPSDGPPGAQDGLPTGLLAPQTGLLALQIASDEERQPTTASGRASWRPRRPPDGPPGAQDASGLLAPSGRASWRPRRPLGAKQAFHACA